MTVLFCYTNPALPALEALSEHAPDAVKVDVRGSDFAYGYALQDHWEAGSDLVNIEQDNIVRADVLAEFAECPEPWCVFPYRLEWFSCDFAIGCVRWRKELMAAVPFETVRDIGVGICRWSDASGGSCNPVDGHCWRHFDYSFFYALTEAGFRRHVHGPMVEHAHVYPPVGAVKSFHMFPEPRARAKNNPRSGDREFLRGRYRSSST